MTPVTRVAAGFAALAALAIVVQLAARERSAPVRCPEGLTPIAGRCCGAGQALVAGRCEGSARTCGPEHVFVQGDDVLPGCVLRERRVAIGSGTLPPGAIDFQARERSAPAHVAAFSIDRGEVSAYRYSECVRAAACSPLSTVLEAGVPVSGLPPQAAEAFCNFAGGRLPSAAEWKLAASGTGGRRFPWGATGLVCRRASFGLSRGPCSTEGTGPDLTGARPAGATPDGVLDLAGNVAEWARDADDRYRARGGSYLSRVAVELLATAVEVPQPAAPHVGFRCVYPSDTD